jgi:hypothetical protein
MRSFIRSLFVIIFAIFSISFFISSTYADHTAHKNKPRKPGLPGYNEACDNASGKGSFRGATPLVGQLDPKVDERGNPTEQCINFTRYGYPIESGDPGYINRNAPPSSFGRPPREGNQYSIACDYRQDTSPYGNNTWESGSCIDDTGKPCCTINTTLEGYPIGPGEAGYVIQKNDRDTCAGIDNRPPFMRRGPLESNQKICAL